jgi:hypothetical protein
LSHTCSLFYSGYFGDGVLWNIWPWIVILLISAVQVAGIIGVSHHAQLCSCLPTVCVGSEIPASVQCSWKHFADTFGLFIVLPVSVCCGLTQKRSYYVLYYLTSKI